MYQKRIKQTVIKICKNMKIIYMVCIFIFNTFLIDTLFLHIKYVFLIRFFAYQICIFDTFFAYQICIFDTLFLCIKNVFFKCFQYIK